MVQKLYNLNCAEAHLAQYYTIFALYQNTKPQHITAQTPYFPNNSNSNIFSHTQLT